MGQEIYLRLSRIRFHELVCSSCDFVHVDGQTEPRWFPLMGVGGCQASVQIYTPDEFYLGCIPSEFLTCLHSLNFSCLRCMNIYHIRLKWIEPLLTWKSSLIGCDLYRATRDKTRKTSFRWKTYMKKQFVTHFGTRIKLKFYGRNLLYYVLQQDPWKDNLLDLIWA
jgi:hypothetical protein